MCYLSLFTWNMLIFCRRMCLQLVLLGSNCFLFTSFCKQGNPFHLVAIVTFWWTAQNTFLEWVSCAVQLKCYMGNISQFWWNCTKWWLEFPKSPSNSAGNLVQHFISLCKMSRSWMMQSLLHFRWTAEKVAWIESSSGAAGWVQGGHY